LDEVAERFLDWGTQGASDIDIQTRAVLAKRTKRHWSGESAPA
jgi:hypothetical protein